MVNRISRDRNSELNVRSARATPALRLLASGIQQSARLTKEAVSCITVQCACTLHYITLRYITYQCHKINVGSGRNTTTCVFHTHRIFFVNENIFPGLYNVHRLTGLMCTDQPISSLLQLNRLSRMPDRISGSETLNSDTCNESLEQYTSSAKARSSSSFKSGSPFAQDSTRVENCRIGHQVSRNLIKIPV